MTKRIRNALVALVGALGLIVAPIALAAPAAAVTYESNVLFFSNDEYTDPEDEDATQIEGLTGAGATVTVFDGGDGSAAVWTAALAGKQALVIPESDQIFDTPVLSVDGAAVIKAFVAAGGTLLLTTDLQSELLSYLTGVDYTVNYETGGEEGGGYPYAQDDAAFPAELTYSNGTYPILVDGWSDAQFAGAYPVYYNDETFELAVGGFFPEEGTGFIYTLAYDWYPEEEEPDASARAVWNTVQGLLLPFVEVAPAPAPELAATGSSVDTGIYIAGAAMLLLAGAAIVATSRRKASA